jgi:ABC-2 type transport system permease protein
MAWWTLYKRELSSYFHSGVAYVVLFGSAVAQSIQFLFIASKVVEIHYTEQSVMQIFFTWPLFWMLLLVQVPLITMRVFSEELKMGTIEMLLTAPVRDWDVVIAKYLGALTFFLVLWSPVALDLTALQLFSSPPPPVYWSEIWLTALTILLVGSFYVSIGVFTSALTKNQIIAAVLCFALLFIPFGVSLLKWIQNLDATLLAWVSYVSTPEHLQNAVQGIFDSRPLVYYITATILMLYLAKSVLESRRLKG